MDQNRVYFFDTTLRDGEQTPGVSLQTPEKIEIAKGLVRLGIDVIEAGFPAASPGDFEAVQTIAREVKGATICALARANEKDVQKAIDALKDAERSRLHVFIAISELHMEYKLKMTRQEVLDKVKSVLAYVRLRLAVLPRNLLLSNIAARFKSTLNATYSSPPYIINSAGR